MNTVKFGAKDSYTDFNLLLTSKKIGLPEVKTVYVDVPGRNGSLDFTEYFGSVKYGNRKLKFTFETTQQHYTRFSNFANENHGKKVDIEVEGYTFKGRISVGEYSWKKGIGSFSVEANCDPFKFSEYVETGFIERVFMPFTVDFGKSNDGLTVSVNDKFEVKYKSNGADKTVSAETERTITDFDLDSNNKCKILIRLASNSTSSMGMVTISSNIGDL